MGKFCEVCEKGLMTGHNVSHSNRKSSRTWAPNVQPLRVIVDGRPMRLNVCTRCLRTMRKFRCSRCGNRCGRSLMDNAPQ